MEMDLRNLGSVNLTIFGWPLKVPQAPACQGWLFVRALPLAGKQRLATRGFLD